MYRKHFGLSRHAFSKEIEADELFSSTAMKELETRLNHLIELRGIGLVTGRERVRQDDGLSQGAVEFAHGAVPGGVRAALDRERDGHVQDDRPGVGLVDRAEPRGAVSSDPERGDAAGQRDAMPARVAGG